MYFFSIDHNIKEKEKIQSMDLVVKKEAWKKTLQKVHLVVVVNLILKEKIRVELIKRKECLQKNK